MISVPETEPHCSLAVVLRDPVPLPVISVPETEPHCSHVRGPVRLGEGSTVISVPETEPHCSWAAFAVGHDGGAA